VKKTATTKVIDTGAIAKDSTLTPAQKSAKLVASGEELMTPTGFMYADVVFGKALEQDPTNKLAQFYKSFLTYPMSMRGIATRIKPQIATADLNTRRDYKRFIGALPEGGLRTFILDGKEDLKVEKDIQGFFDEQNKALDTFRSYLKANKALALTLNVTTWNVPGGEAISMCNVSEVANGVYEIQLCPSTVRAIKVERADFETLQQSVAGAQIYLAMLNSYDASGAITASKKLGGSPQTNEAVYNELSKDPEFGKLRNSGAALKAIVDLGMDGVAGVRWALSMQDQLCPGGIEADRSGYLIDKGICINQPKPPADSVETVLENVEIALSGNVIQVALGKPDGALSSIKPAAVLTNPVQDLKALSPSFDSCGFVVGLADSTINGLFPIGDGNDHLKQASSCGR
jgi:hypothetical protein